MLQSMGSQRVGHEGATELTEGLNEKTPSTFPSVPELLNECYSLSFLLPPSPPGPLSGSAHYERCGRRRTPPSDSGAIPSTASRECHHTDTPSRAPRPRGGCSYRGRAGSPGPGVFRDRGRAGGGEVGARDDESRRFFGITVIIINHNNSNSTGSSSNQLLPI